MSIAEKFEVIADSVYDKGVRDGKESQYDEFWDSYQDFGKRTAYYQAFSGEAWTSITCKPKYHIKPITCGRIFANSKFTNGNITDYFNELGVELDFSNAISASEMLSGSTISGLGVVDLRKASLAYVFGGARNLKKIQLVIIKDDGSTKINIQSFQNCEALEDITIQGTIGQDVTFQWSPLLTEESIKSIVEHLSSTATGKAVTFKKEAVNREFGINVDDASTFPEGSDYYKLRWSKPNWDFSYTE